MSDIFREVDEDVRRDKALELWQKYQPLFIALAALAILATAGWRIYDYWRVRMAQSASRHYTYAIDLAREGKSETSLAELNRLIVKAPAGYRTLARLRAASEIAKSKPTAGADAFDAIAADSSVGATFQELARLRAAMVLVDTADAKELKSRLEPLADPHASFRHTARELLAIVALKANDNEAASKWLTTILTDPASPPDLMQRAQSLLALVKGTKAATG